MVVDQLVADDAKLVIIPRDRSRLHRTWVMHRLRVRNVSVDTAMPFESTLTNAVPPGENQTEGTFGPWHRDDPGHTPIEGRFTFDHADLGVFKGISGTLASTGTYSGRLETIRATGEADVPNFKVDIGGHEVPLHASYDAVIDGTNGDTRLDRVDAKFLNTSVRASGGVYDVEGVKGRDVKMAVVIDSGRLEDVMRLVVNSRQAADDWRLEAAGELRHPGQRDGCRRQAAAGGTLLDRRRPVHECRRAAGDQRDELARERQAREGRAKTSAEPKPAVRSVGRQTSRGSSSCATACCGFRRSSSTSRAPLLRLSGRVRAPPRDLAFTGNLYMDAKVSQTVTGWRSWLLKVADPLFRENGQTVVPVKIAGTRSAPAFGMEVGRIFKKDD